jgi:hypothetical protein
MLRSHLAQIPIEDMVRARQPIVSIDKTGDINMNEAEKDFHELSQSCMRVKDRALRKNKRP